MEYGGLQLALAGDLAAGSAAVLAVAAGGFDAGAGRALPGRPRREVGAGSSLAGLALSDGGVAVTPGSGAAGTLAAAVVAPAVAALGAGAATEGCSRAAAVS